MADLDAELQRALRARYLGSPPPSPASRSRLMERIRKTPPPKARRGVVAWLVSGRNLTLSPLVSAGVAAGLLVLGGALALSFQAVHPPRAERSPQHPLAPAATRYVQFVLVAPHATSVAVVGDFNAWDPDGLPMTRTGDIWTRTIPVTRGRHVYAFVVDGEHWVSDPIAPLAPEDEFGFRKSVLIVGASEPT